LGDSARTLLRTWAFSP